MKVEEELKELKRSKSKSSKSFDFFLDSIKFYYKDKKSPFAYYKKVYPTLSPDILALFRYFFNSSLVFIKPSYIGKHTKNVTKVDVNSFYPSIFLKYKMPHGEPFRASDYDDEDPNHYYLIIAQCYFEKMIINYFPLSSVFASFESGSTIVAFFSFEIKNIKRCFKVFKFSVIDIIAFKKEKSYLGEYIKYYYETKINAFPRGSQERTDNKEKINLFLGHMCKSTAGPKNYYYKPVGMVMRALSKKIILDYCFDVIGINNVIGVYTDAILFKHDDEALKKIPISNQIGDFKFECFKGEVEIIDNLCYHIWDKENEFYKNKKRFHFEKDLKE